MLPQEVIRAKRDGQALSAEAISDFIAGLTTGWVVRSELKSRGVNNITGATYNRIDGDGVHITIGGEDSLIPADTVIVCAGQESDNALYNDLTAAGVPATVIGGAEKSAGLDALGAIRQGTEAALAL